MNNDITEELTPYKPKKNKKNFYIIFAIIALVLIAGAVIVYFYLNSHSEEEYAKNLSLGQKYLEEGNYDQAIIAFNDAIKVNKKEPEAYNYLAQSAVLAQDYPLAHEAYDNLIELSENKVKPTIGKAEVYIAEENYTKAEKLLESLKEKYPDNQDIEYASNYYEYGNDPNNIINGGEVAYDNDGNIYFVSNSLGEDPGYIYYSAKILCYNPQTKETREVINETDTSDDENHITNLSVWNNRLYYNFSQYVDDSTIISCNIYGTDRKELTSEYKLKYIYKGKLFVEKNDDLEGELFDGNIEFFSLNLDGSLSEKYDTGLLDSPDYSTYWMVINDSIYYLLKNSHTDQIQLMQLDINNKSNINASSVPFTSKESYDNANGIYYNDDLIYFIFSREENIYSYNLKTKESVKLNLSYDDQGGGFNINNNYIIRGTSNSGTFTILDKSNQDLVKSVNAREFEINLNDLQDYDYSLHGVYLTPTSFIISPTYYFDNGSNRLSYQDFYEVTFDNWSGKLLYSENKKKNNE